MSETEDRCPNCLKKDWRDLDMDTGELFCAWCGEVVEEAKEDG